MNDKEVEAALDEIKSLIKEVEQHLTKKKGPVVPWVGALLKDKMGYFVLPDHNTNTKCAEIIDSPLHPQFMPNDGVNPWPDKMMVQVVLDTGDVATHEAYIVGWFATDKVIGSRPACGWAEYLKKK